MEAYDKSNRKSHGHAVFVTFPLQSSVKQMLQFAKLLHHKGLDITIVNTEFIHKRLLKSRGQNSLDVLPNFRFETIPDGLPSSSEENHSPDLKAVCENIANNVILQPFLDLLAKLMNNHHSPVTCIVSDGFMPFTTTAAEKFGLPIVLFFHVAASSVMQCHHLYTLNSKGLIQFSQDESSESSDTAVELEGIPGMKEIRMRDLVSYLRLIYQDQTFFNFTMKPFEQASKASAIVIHSFHALEQKVLDHLSSNMFPNIFTVGPLELFVNQIKEEEDIKLLNSIGYSLWKEETDQCFEWLNSKQPNSVIYVNFGSCVFITRQQFIELAMGLANSDQQFLWIIRQDLAIGDTASEFPYEFEQVKAQGKCFIASWCQQDEVLNHSSIGGFLTHAGWASVLESLSAGVPMICWPFGGDHILDSRCICDEWKAGMEIKAEEGEEHINRNQVEKFVRELMQGEEGKKLRDNAADWKRISYQAVANPDGSSFRNVDKLVNQFLIPIQINKTNVC